MTKSPFWKIGSNGVKVVKCGNVKLEYWVTRVNVRDARSVSVSATSFSTQRPFIWIRVIGLPCLSCYSGRDTSLIILFELFRKCLYAARYSLASFNRVTLAVGSPSLRDRVTLWVQASFNHFNDLIDAAT